MLKVQCCSKRNKKRKERKKAASAESFTSRSQRAEITSKKKSSAKPLHKKGSKEKRNNKLKECPSSEGTEKMNSDATAPENGDRRKSHKKNTKMNWQDKRANKRIAGAMGNAFRKKIEDVAQQDERTFGDARDECIALDKVKKLGNLDVICARRRAEIEKEIESMQSEHEMERQKNDQKNAKLIKDKHVTITENKCKLYETNDEPTLDEEIDDPALLLLEEAE